MVSVVKMLDVTFEKNKKKYAMKDKILIGILMGKMNVFEKVD